MARYRVLLKPSVEKDLRVIPKRTLGRLLLQIEGLAADPFPSKSRGGGGVVQVAGRRHRIIYAVDTRAIAVTVHYVRHRREAYRGL